MSAATEKIAKPEKPNEEEYNANLKTLQDEHAALMEKLNAIKSKLDLTKSSSNGSQNPAQAKSATLRAELNEIKATQSSKKNSKGQLLERQKAIQDAMANKIAAQKAARSKVPFKSPEEVDAAIAKLDAQVEGGTLKLVDERKALADISMLRKQRKLFAGFEEAQSAIDKDKDALADLRKQMDDPEARSLSDRYTEVQDELNVLKAEQNSAYQNLSTLRDERTKLQGLQQDKYQDIKNLKDQFYESKSAYYAYEQEIYKQKQERRKAEQDAYMKEKRRKIAEKILEEASEKAYTNEIITCEGLINYFDPENATKKTESQPRELAAQASRTITEAPKGTKLTKKDDREEDYFIGGKSKKGKKGRGQAGATEAPAPASSGKFSLSLGVLEELGRVDVHPPMAQEDVPSTLEKLREKLAFYKENQEKVTAENMAKAQAEIDKLDTSSHSNGKKSHKTIEDSIQDLAVSDETPAE